ncbi:Hpt domain-containing protein [Pararhodobacter sp. CCB-MM2]|uniref:Hpt domain-containing protein n=1 Tax=Pararhodobacter sp. CCB-MM2 TaxID=1786003 RepID=UPI00083480CF|nr:Hpt domain-containing protein [Pararhodobacter sp. CCB-MM2]
MIDWSHVAELRSDMGEAFDEVVEVFLQEVEEGLARLDPAGPAEDLAADLHFLKGAALNLGFREFAALCAQSETQANNGEAAKVDLPAVRRSYENSRVAFIDGLPKLAA